MWLSWCLCARRSFVWRPRRDKKRKTIFFQLTQPARRRNSPRRLSDLQLQFFLPESANPRENFRTPSNRTARGVFVLFHHRSQPEKRDHYFILWSGLKTTTRVSCFIWVGGLMVVLVLRDYAGSGRRSERSCWHDFASSGATWYKMQIHTKVE